MASLKSTGAQIKKAAGRESWLLTRPARTVAAHSASEGERRLTRTRSSSTQSPARPGQGAQRKRRYCSRKCPEGSTLMGVGHHRHMAELDQEFTSRRPRGGRVFHAASGADEPRHISTIYVRGRKRTAEELHVILAETT